MRLVDALAGGVHPREGDDRLQRVLEVDVPALLGSTSEVDVAGQPDRWPERERVARQLVLHAALLGQGRVDVSAKLSDQPGIAVHQPEVEEDVEVGDVLRLRAAQPGVIGPDPVGQRPAPLGFAGHDLAAA